MNITVYLPDEIGSWAKEHELPVSQLLRSAIEDERNRRKAIADTLSAAEVHELNVTDDDERAYKVRLHGSFIAGQGDEEDGIFVYLGKDEKVYVYDGPNDGRFHEDVSPDDLRNWLGDDSAYIDAMQALGLEAVIDVGRDEWH